MTKEQRKDNTYFDQTGRQILVGDLIRVFHFKNGKRNRYMYHVVVMQETDDFPVMSAKAHYAEKPHYPLFVVADNPRRIFFNAKIIAVKDWETTRKKIKI